MAESLFCLLGLLVNLLVVFYLGKTITKINALVIYARTVFLTFLIAGGALSQGFSQEGFPYCESFQNNQLEAFTRLGGQARLAGGALRLTEASEDQNGYAYVDLPFPSHFGIKVVFEYFCYGGTGADGLAFFLFDAALQGFSPGGFGGALGYAQRNELPGISRAYLGLGLDTFGNFGNDSEGKNGGFPEDPSAIYPNAVVLRGPGNGIQGYPFVAGRLVNQGGVNGLAESARFPICSGTNRVTNEEEVGYRKVFLDLIPQAGEEGFLVNLEMLVTTQTGNPSMVSILEDVPFNYIPPSMLKLGFSASTGQLTNIHEIRNLEVMVSDMESLGSPQGLDVEVDAACIGLQNTYDLEGKGFILPNEGGQLQCIRFFASENDLLQPEEDLCQSGNCGQVSTELELEQGLLSVGESGYQFFFTPNEGWGGESVRVYYTLTDNYGMVSSGNLIDIPIRDDPGDVVLSVEGIPLEEWYLCHGESVELTVEGSENFSVFEWYKDNEMLESGGDVFSVTQEGIYRVDVFNEQGCKTTSQDFLVVVPELAELGIVSPVRGCNPEAPIFITQEIDPYFPEEFDYRVTTLDGNILINQEMDTIYASGDYQLSLKPKEVDCWSEPVSFRINVADSAMQALFDYGIDGTERKTDDEGGVFIEDPIWFTDHSTGNPVAWEWDFGNGQTSRARNPVHVFGETGVYLVTLTVTNNIECEATFSMEVVIDRSYRIMFPTGFTPDSEENTHFRPKTKGVTRMELMVFNKWGEMIFKSDDLNTDGWDGYLNGVALPPGRYVYRANIESVEGEKVTRTGSVLMVR